MGRVAARRNAARAPGIMVRRAERKGNPAMESKAKAFGHAIHPMLIVFPLGLFATALIFDIIYYPTNNDLLGTASFYMIAAGVIGGLAAAIAGAWDWLAVPEGTRAKRVGLLHGGGNVVMVALFIISWLLRLGTPQHTVTIASFILEIIGIGIALVTAWLGGELVERLGVGVDPDANLNAPSSLSGNSLAPDMTRTPRAQTPRSA